jgi:hypothetical protein
MPSTQLEVTERREEKDPPAKNLLIHNPEKQLSPRAQAFLARPKKLYINGQFVDAPMEERSRPKIRRREPVSLQFHRPERKMSSEPRSLLARLLKSDGALWHPPDAPHLLKLADLIAENVEELAHLGRKGLKRSLS